MTDNNNRNTLKEAFDAELMKRLEENPPEIPTYEEFSAMVDKSLAERCRRRKRIAGIAAGFVVVLLAGILACSNLATDVDADKNPKEEIITEDGIIIEDGGWGSSEYEDNIWMTEDWNEVEDAKKLFSSLSVPTYIPKGYMFERLTIETLPTGGITCEYLFNNGNQPMEIEQFVHNSTLISTDKTSLSRIIKTMHGEMFITEKENKIATILINDGIVINIWSNLSDDELVQIVDNLNF